MVAIQPSTHRTTTRRSPRRRLLLRGSLVLLVLLLARTSLAALEPFALGGRHLLGTGELHEGSVVLVGGEMTIAPGARVDGSVTVIGGELDLGGSVAGTVHAYGSSVRLRESAVVDGSLESVASDVERAPSAVIRGRLHGDRFTPMRADVMRRWTVTTERFGGVGFALSVAVQAGLMALLTFAAASVMPDRLTRIADDLTEAPVAAGLTGLVAMVVAAVTAVIAAVTLIGIPVTLLIGFGAWLAVLIGLTAFADWVGHTVWHEGDSRGARAALGGFLVGLGWAALALVPVLAGPFQAVASLVAFGAVVRTRGGGRTSPSTATVGASTGAIDGGDGSGRSAP
jgi:hypothetical protein